MQEEEEEEMKEEGLFEYVSEEQYSKIVQGRQEEGFVVNDGEGGGRRDSLSMMVRGEG